MGDDVSEWPPPLKRRGVRRNCGRSPGGHQWDTRTDRWGQQVTACRFCGQPLPVGR